jgi:hypothetical protein
MRYQTIPTIKIPTATKHMLDGNKHLAERSYDYSGEGADLDLTAIEQLVKELDSQLKSFLSETTDRSAGWRDAFEGSIAGQVHQTLSHIDTEILDDPGFWRFLSIDKFWPIVYWRQQETFDAGDPSRYLTYVDAKNSTYCVLLRIFIRGQIAFESSGSYELASASKKATDFWNSHIVGVDTWQIPPVVKSLLEAYRDDRNSLTTAHLRSLAKHLRRRRASILLHGYTKDEADDLIRELRESAE